MRKLVALGLVATVASLAALSTLPAGATVSGPNGKIVVASQETSFTIDPDGSDINQIGPAGSTFCSTWSPDSSKVLCNFFSEEGGQAATANPDGSGITLLSPDLPLACLNWSPDGTRLLCTTPEEVNPAEAGLYNVRSSDAGDLVRVTATPPGGLDIGYGYSPDGSRILYTRFDSSDTGTLFSVKPDGGEPVQLSPTGLSVIDLGFFDRIGADWSPDGSHVVFAAQKLSSGSFKTALFVVNADGTGLRQITPSGIGAISAQWSPSGGRIAFTSCCSGPAAWVVHPDGTGLGRVTTPVGRAVFLTPVWSPDSTKLLFNRVDRNGEVSLWTANTDGSGLSKLTDRVSSTFPSSYTWGSAPAD